MFLWLELGQRTAKRDGGAAHAIPVLVSAHSLILGVPTDLTVGAEATGEGESQSPAANRALTR